MLTEEERHRDFPSLECMTYLNTAAESVPPVCVTQAVSDYMHHKRQGMRGRDLHFPRVEQCRQVTARFLGLTPAEVGFCSCSSEAYNLLATALHLSSNDEVVVSDLDFPAGATPWLTAVEKPATRLWQARSGELITDDLIPLLNNNTKLVQLSLVSFYNGFRLNWAEVAPVIRRLAPQAILSVDVTQALGRVDVSQLDADIFISSTHKWTLGIHGGGIVGVPQKRAQRLTTHAGGWYHLGNAFDADRFQRATVKSGAASYSVGMPSFAALYALDAALRYVERAGVSAIQAQTDPLLSLAATELRGLGIHLMAPLDQIHRPTGILAFQHPNSAGIHAALEAAEVHVMHHAGRIRVAFHGYNTEADVHKLCEVIRQVAA